MKRKLRSFTIAFTAFLTIMMPQSLFASESTLQTWNTHPGGLVFPTGCPLGDGPQYQGFSPGIGRLVKEPKQKERISFNPIAISRNATTFCNAQISGQAICQNACRQLWVGDPKGTGNSVDDPEAFKKCTKICPGVPTFHRTKGSVENKAFIH